MLSAITSYLLGAICYGLDKMVTAVLGFLDLSLDTAVSAFPILPSMYGIFRSIALGIVLISTAYTLTVVLAGDTRSMTESPFKTVAMAMIAVSLIYWGNYILVMLTDTFSTVYNSVKGMYIEVDTPFDSLVNTVGELIDGDAVDATKRGGSLLLSLLVVLVFGFSLIKLVIEVCERYLILVVNIFVAPMYFATLAAPITRDIFRRWVGRFFGANIMMVMSAVFLKILVSGMSTILTGTTDLSTFFLKTILLLAMTRIAARVDEALNSLGLSVARTGAGIIGDIALASRAIRGVINAGSRVAAAGTSVANAVSRGIGSGQFGNAFRDRGGQYADGAAAYRRNYNAARRDGASIGDARRTAASRTEQEMQKNPAIRETARRETEQAKQQAAAYRNNLYNTAPVGAHSSAESLNNSKAELEAAREKNANAKLKDADGTELGIAQDKGKRDLIDTASKENRSIEAQAEYGLYSGGTGGFIADVNNDPIPDERTMASGTFYNAETGSLYGYGQSVAETCAQNINKTTGNADLDEALTETYANTASNYLGSAACAALASDANVTSLAHLGGERQAAVNAFAKEAFGDAMPVAFQPTDSGIYTTEPMTSTQNPGRYAYMNGTTADNKPCHAEFVDNRAYDTMAKSDQAKFNRTFEAADGTQWHCAVDSSGSAGGTKAFKISETGSAYYSPEPAANARKSDIPPVPREYQQAAESAGAQYVNFGKDGTATQRVDLQPQSTIQGSIPQTYSTTAPQARQKPVSDKVEYTDYEHSISRPPKGSSHRNDGYTEININFGGSGSSTPESEAFNSKANRNNGRGRGRGRGKRNPK